MSMAAKSVVASDIRVRISPFMAPGKTNDSALFPDSMLKLMLLQSPHVFPEYYDENASNITKKKKLPNPLARKSLPIISP